MQEQGFLHQALIYLAAGVLVVLGRPIGSHPRLEKIPGPPDAHLYRLR